MSLVLEADGVTVQFGGLVAVDAVTLRLHRGERRAIIGPNGAGKTTFFNLIGGQIRPTSGEIRLFGEPVTTKSPRNRAELGLVRTFQATALFSSMTVAENIILSLQALDPRKYVVYRPVLAYRDLMARVEEIVAKWSLSKWREAPVAHMSHGEQRQLEIILAIESSPRLLLLDEPTAGLAPAETQAVTELIGALDRSVTILLIEHDMDVAFRIAESFTVFHQGRIVVEGSPDEIRRDPRVAELYFGPNEAPSAVDSRA